MKTLFRMLAASAFLLPAVLMAQAPQPAAQTPRAPAGPPGGGQPRLSVTSTAWPDGGEIPMRHASRGDNKSPAFEFQWFTGTAPGAAPATLQSYAVIFHDIENSSMRGTADTLHWTAFNIPATAKGLPEGLAPGDLPDGTVHGPGLGRRNGAGGYFGPGAGPGPFHHYVFEFYALDTKLTLPATTTREELLKAMDGHVVGKAGFFGRFHGPAQ
ncbi:MAG: YbhB/YbcL family Raf kinase inhibitor-like protein [Vicinamibacterales bacterium]